MTCLYCDRDCDRCGYPIRGGFEHIEQPQAKRSNVVVCNLTRVVRPLVDVLDAYFTHEQHRLQSVPEATP